MRKIMAGAPGAGAAALAVGMLLGSGAPARADCFSACIAADPVVSQDHFKMADGVRACRDMCTSEALDGLRKVGLYEAYAACKPRALTRDEFRAVRAASASWRQQLNIFTWEVRNIFPDKLLTGIEVATQDLNLSTVSVSAASVIPPNSTGTFVVPDFFDGYPAVRYATKVATIIACDLPKS